MSIAHSHWGESPHLCTVQKWPRNLRNGTITAVMHSIQPNGIDPILPGNWKLTRIRSWTGHPSIIQELQVGKTCCILCWIPPHSENLANIFCNFAIWPVKSSLTVGSLWTRQVKQPVSHRLAKPKSRMEGDRIMVGGTETILIRISEGKEESLSSMSWIMDWTLTPMQVWSGQIWIQRVHNPDNIFTIWFQLQLWHLSSLSLCTPSFQESCRLLQKLTWIACLRTSCIVSKEKTWPTTFLPPFRRCYDGCQILCRNEIVNNI